jgi:hypothetical protein
MADSDPNALPGYTPRVKVTPLPTTTSTTTTPTSNPATDIPGYTPRASVGTAPAPGGVMNYVDPVLKTVGDLTNRTMAEAHAPWSQIGSDAASTFREGQWLGLDQPALAVARGITPDQQRQQDAEAYKRLGWAGMPVTAAGYATGGGAAGVGKALAAEAMPLFSAVRPTVGRYLSGIIGGAGEGGLANSASTLFHGGSLSDATKAFWPGAALGGVGGATGGLQPDVNTNVSPVPKLKAQESKIYGPLDNIPYHGNDVTKNVNGTVNGIVQASGPNQWKNATSTNAVVNDLIKQPWRSAADIQKAQEKLRDISRDNSASNEDRRFAGQVADGLDSLHQNAQPTYGSFKPGDAATILEQGKPITQQRKNAEMLDEAQRQADLKQNPYYAAQVAADELSKNPQFYAGRNPSQPGGYDVNDPRYVAMQKLADSAPKGGANPSSPLFKHIIAAPASATVGGALANTLGIPAAEGSLAGLGLYGAAVPAFKSAQNAWNTFKTRAAYEPAYQTLTGQPAPLAPFKGVLGDNTYRDIFRMGIYGNEAQPSNHQTP